MTHGRTILSLDLGQKTGWAIRLADGTITSGVQLFHAGRYEGAGMVWLRFCAWLSEVDRMTGGIDIVTFEEVRHHVAVDAAHAYGGFLSHLTAWSEDKGIPYLGVHVGTIKKHATGKGNAGKPAMIAAAIARGHSPTDDNEADALCLLHWTIEQGYGNAP